MINITTGGGHGMSLDERTAAARRFAPELCSLNMGSMNFATFPMAAGITHYKHDWEPGYLEVTARLHLSQHVRRHRDDRSRRWASKAPGSSSSATTSDISTPRALLDARRSSSRRCSCRLIFGILGGIGPDVENLVHMKTIAERLFGDDFHLSVLGAGRHQTNLVTIGAIMGGNVRVGLEDSLFLSRGQLATSNAAQVAKIIRILNELSLEPATPDEARELLALKGAAQTNIP